jgi:hypothetical protein
MAIIGGVLGVVGVIFTIFLSVNLFNKIFTPVENERIMYGYQNYDDYVANRSEVAKLNDENLINAANESVGKGEYKNIAATAQEACDKGFEYLNSNDYSTAMKRFNQGFLLDHNQPCVYAGYGYYLGFTSKDPQILQKSFTFYEKAISLSDPKSNEDHKNPWWIYRDYAEIVEHYYLIDTSKIEYLDKSQTLLEKSIALKDHPRTHRVFAFVYYDKKDYKNAWNQVHIAINGGMSVESFGAFIDDLKKKMPDPQGKY